MSILGALIRKRIDAYGLTQELASAIQRRTTDKWLRESCVQLEVASFLDRRSLRVSKLDRTMMERHLSHMLSGQLIKAIGKANNLSVRSARLPDQQQFVVHEYMSPWFLIKEHGARARHPEKDWDFWYSRPHREWVNECLSLDELVPNLPEQFEQHFSDWLEAGLVSRLHAFNNPVRGTLYEVKTRT